MAKILVVDDDPDICDLVALKLRRSGHDVSTRSDGAQGLAAARELHPDLIVLDWMMPHLTGPEVCSILRGNPEFDDITLVLLTARAQEEDVQRARAAGVDAYVTKPFSPRDLVEQLEQLLGAPVPVRHSA